MAVLKRKMFQGSGGTKVGSNSILGGSNNRYGKAKPGGG